MTQLTPVAIPRGYSDFKYTSFHSNFDHFHTYGGKYGIMKHILSWRHFLAIKSKNLAKKRPQFPKMKNFQFFSVDYRKSWFRNYFLSLTFFLKLVFEILAFWAKKGQKFKREKLKKMYPLNHGSLQSNEISWKVSVSKNFGLLLANFLALMAKKCLQLKICFMIPHLPPYVWNDQNHYGRRCI